ncbi:hypothetical protein, partial [Escherichia coli]|uniref:hypothetical protein n=1 Tax=Escherichia coli TaxID=562 RepID=UPI003078F14A
MEEPSEDILPLQEKEEEVVVSELDSDKYEPTLENTVEVVHAVSVDEEDWEREFVSMPRPTMVLKELPMKYVFVEDEQGKPVIFSAELLIFGETELTSVLI